MITVCELCEKISIEEAIREAKRLEEEAQRHLEKIALAETFVEQILAPIVENLKSMPKNLFLGYRHKFGCSEAFYKGIGEWKESYTARRNLKRERNLAYPIENPNNINFALLDFTLVNDYLRDFGFQIICEEGTYVSTEYTSSTRDAEASVIKLYLSTLCENFQ